MKEKIGRKKEKKLRSWKEKGRLFSLLNIQFLISSNTGIHLNIMIK